MLDIKPEVLDSKHHDFKGHTSGRKAPEISDTVLNVGSVFASWEDARTALFTAEEKLGYRWKLD